MFFIAQQADVSIIGAQHHADHLRGDVIHRLAEHMAARNVNGAILVGGNLAGGAGLLQLAREFGLSTRGFILLANGDQLRLRRFPLAAGFAGHNAEVYLVEARLIGIFGFQPL